MPTFDGVLFDLDGVLIDSEHLAEGVWVRTLAEHGLPIPANEFSHLAVGQTFPNVLLRLQELHGWTATDAFLPVLEERFNEAFDTVPAIEGARETLLALRAAGVPFAVASNSERGRLHLKLRASGLTELVGEHAYDPSWVGGRGKPNPDLYVFAAAQLDVDVARCVVVEDSVPGGTAGVRAGATLFALLAAGHIHPDSAAQMQTIGAARVLYSHRELQGALGLTVSS
ncbi:HAD family hydrolase [Deinococcus radiotolerans]|uniref:Beta-phosphoglucomutase n=1 Tax=Deinococcus radiotolerans TaxID=1309407 RepID=A0ABQ2FHD0_9DEIO|nr:HAD family phosphatase [Deinococcus radiotolerans]GGK88925.1 beta-phosphoglucomutase [Deinococcus radiotolerans]